MGVTVLAILAAIAGVFGIFRGIAWLTSSSYIGIAADSGELGALAALVGAITLIAGIGYLLFAWGAWGKSSWAWTLGLVIAAVVLVISIFEIFRGDWSALISIVLAGAVAYYLYTPEVKAAFGRS